MNIEQPYCNATVQDGIHAANRRTQQAIQAAMHRTYDYLISSLDEQPSIVDQATGLCFSLIYLSVVR